VPNVTGAKYVGEYDEIDINDVGTIDPPNVGFVYVPVLTSMKLFDGSDKSRFAVV
jgi:hypothetical protein